MIPFLWLCRPVSIAPPAGAFSACCRTWCASRRKATRRNGCVIFTLFSSFRSFRARRPAWLVPAVCSLVGPGAAGGAVGVRDIAQTPADLRGCAGCRRVGGPGRVLVRRPVAEGLGDAVRAGPRILGGGRPVAFPRPEGVEAVPLPAGRP